MKKLSDRTYKCVENNTMNRDFKAAITLTSYLPCIPREVKSVESYTNHSNLKDEVGLDEPESLHSDGKHEYNNLKVINF